METAMYNNITTKKPITFNLLDVLVWFYMAHRVLPAVGQYTPGIVFLGVFAMLALTLCISRKNMINTPAFAKLIFVFSVSLLSLAMRMAEGDMTTTFTYAYGQLQSFLYGWIALYYVSKGNITKTRRLLNLTIVFYVITIVTTYVGNIMYPQASRLLATFASDNSTYKLYTSLNIGGFGFVYEVALFSTFLIYLIKTKRMKKLWGVLSLLAIAVFLLQLEYTTALMLFLSSVCLLFIPRLTAKKILIVVAVVLVLILLLGSVVAILLDTFAELLPGSTMSARLKYFANVLRGEDVGETEASGDRMELYRRAINDLVNSKFMGTWGDTKASEHSFILDNMANFGIIGMAALVLTYVLIYKQFVKAYKNKDYYPYLVWIYVMAIILAILNPKLNQFTFIFMIPLFAKVVDYYSERRVDDENTMGSK